MFHSYVNFKHYLEIILKSQLNCLVVQMYLSLGKLMASQDLTVFIIYYFIHVENEQCKRCI